MKKPDALRAAMAEHNSYLTQNPDKFKVFVADGHVEATAWIGPTGKDGGSFEYHYTLKLLVMDYPLDPNTLMVPIVSWVRDWQPEILTNYDMQRTAIKFEVEVLTDSTSDVLIELPLTESVDVRVVDGLPVSTYRIPPMLDPKVRKHLGIDP